jgi:hypothetical protein
MVAHIRSGVVHANPHPFPRRVRVSPFQVLTLRASTVRNDQRKAKRMARTRTKPLEITPENFMKCLAQKAEIEKEIAKQTKRLEAVKNDLKLFKKMVDDLTK